ncbi:MAG: hypothetical protein Q4P15_00700 [Propionibacteriaceae bacterium]|nr:hypothetical protein [Propionibacteriaceae bacterium]
MRYSNGRFISTTGWTFNNLTYLPSTRASWVGNNLGQNNGSWKSGDRTWRTECDTAVTGSGGCRSYVWAKQVHSEGGRYVSKSDWVFNNIVLFSTSKVAPVTTVPAWIIDQSRLDFTGLTGTPLQIGAPMKDLATLGYFKFVEEEFPWYSSESLENRGISTSSSGDSMYHLRDVELRVKGIRTVDGAQVGMTLGQIKAIYGNRLRLEVKDGHWDMYTAVVQSGGYELVFWNTWDRPLVDSDVINFIRARKVSPDLF